MHQNDSTFKALVPIRHWVGAACLLLLLCGSPPSWGDEDAPTAAMLQPVNDLVRFMSTLRPADHAQVFTRQGLCIIENFAPFVFCGAGAAKKWEAGFRAHAGEGALGALMATFGRAQDFSRARGRVYFSLPTTWTGVTNGRRFEEHGAWAFVLERVAGAWKIAGYGWGVTSYSEDGHSP